MPQLRFHSLTLRRIRATGAALFLLTATVIAITAIRDAAFVRSDCWFIGLGSGCIRAGRSDYYVNFGGRAEPGWYWESAWHPDWAVAWRPFHVQTGIGDRYFHSDYIAVPLWPLAVGSILACAWAVGSLRAARILCSSSCSTCGYDLSGGPVGNSPRCPECGTSTDIPIGN